MNITTIHLFSKPIITSSKEINCFLSLSFNQSDSEEKRFTQRDVGSWYSKKNTTKTTLSLLMISIRGYKGRKIKLTASYGTLCTKKMQMNQMTTTVWPVHPEPDILEGEVKWALGSTAINKASRCNRIPVELFKP